MPVLFRVLVNITTPVLLVYQTGLYNAIKGIL